MNQPIPSSSSSSSILATWMLAVTAITSVGCLGALQHSNETRHTAARSQRIEAACAAKDLDALDWKKHYEPDQKNRERMQTCFLGIKTERLVALECPAFTQAFEWIEAMDGSVKVSKRNPLSDFASDLTDQSAAQVDAVRLPILEKAVACRAGGVLFSDLRVGLGDQGWDRAFDAAEHKGLHLYPLLLSYVRGAHTRLKTEHIVGWLARTQGAKQCGELAEVTRNDENLRADMLYFFVQKGCKSAAHSVAAELLASPAAGYRARGCMALRDLGDRSEMSRMRLLASRDTARALESGSTGFWLVTFVTYPVREACQDALNQLELKASAKR